MDLVVAGSSPVSHPIPFQEVAEIGPEARASNWATFGPLLATSWAALLGEFLAMAEKNKGGGEKGVGRRGNRNVQCQGGTAQTPTLASLGITKKESAEAQWLAEVKRGQKITVAIGTSAMSFTTMPETSPRLATRPNHRALSVSTNQAGSSGFGHP